PDRLPRFLTRPVDHGFCVPARVAAGARVVGAREVHAADRIGAALQLGSRSTGRDRHRRDARSRPRRLGDGRAEGRRRGVRSGPAASVRRPYTGTASHAGGAALTSAAIYLPRACGRWAVASVLRLPLTRLDTIVAWA